MKKMFLILAFVAAFSFAVVPNVNSHYLLQNNGTWSNTSTYKIKVISGTSYYADPIVVESLNGGLYALSGESAAIVGTLPESQPTAWYRLQ